MDIKKDFLPLGTVVSLESGTRKLIIISRGLNVKHGDETVFFDYGGALYPDGLTADAMAYFNRENVDRVYFMGYDDDDNKLMTSALENYLKENPDIKRIDPSDWN